jgi:acyl carrier protein
MSTVEALEQMVKDGLSELSTRYGLECPTLESGTRPMLDIQGLDSLHCVELIVDLSERAHLDVDNEVFWDESGSFRTIAQVALLLHNCGKGSGT